MARSGTLGALDQEGLDHPDGYVYTAHLADCRTYGGFSGSPVFAQFDAPVLESFDQSRLPYTWLCGMLTWHLADNRGQYASLYGVVAILRHNEIWEGLMAFQDERDEADKVNAAKIAASKPRPTNVSARQELPEEFARFEDLARQLAHTPKPEQDKSSQ